MAVKHAGHQLNSDHLLLILGIWNALVILSALKGKLLLIAVLLLLDQRLDKLRSFHPL